MYPQLISYPHISSYSALLLAGFVAGYVLARRLARRSGIEGRHVDNLTLLFLLLGLGGARLFSRIFYLPKEHWWEAFLIWQGGGLVFYGGFLCAVAGAIAYARLCRISPRVLLDLFAPAAALGLAFGRVGCFMAGCCWGDVCVAPADTAKVPANLKWQVHSVPPFSRDTFPLQVTFPKTSEVFRDQAKLGVIPAEAERAAPVHPVQLYETAGALVLCVWLVRHSRKRRFSGEVFCRLVLGYALLRFGLEFLRADNPPIYYGLTVSQVTSLFLGVAAIGLWREGAKRRATKETPSEELAGWDSLPVAAPPSECVTAREPEK